MKKNRKSNQGRYLIISGTLLVIAVFFADILLGKGRIVIGPRSIFLCAVFLFIIRVGFALKNNKASFDKLYGYLLAVIILFHVLNVFQVIPPDIISGSEHIKTSDYGFHYYQGITVNHFLKNHGKSWGYDPYFMAGYPMGTIFDFNNKASEMFMYLFSFIRSGVAFNLFFFLFYALLPAFIYGSARNFGGTRKEGMLAALLSVLFWAVDSSMRWAYFCGMFSFAITSFMSVYVFSLFYRYVKNPSVVNLVIMFISGILMFFIPSSVFVLIFPVGTCFIVFLARKQYKLNITIIALAISVILASSFWLIPFFRFYHYKISSAQFLLGTPLTLFHDLTSTIGFSPGTFLRRTLFVRWIIIFFGIYGLYLWKRNNKTLRFYSFTGLSAGMFLLAYFGSVLGFTAELQPYRFVLPLSFFLTVPASAAMIDVFRGFKKNINISIALPVILLLFLLVPVTVDAILQFYVHTPVVYAGLSSDEETILKWIKKNTDRSGRIAYEDNGSPVSFINKIKREFIGGPYMYTFIKHSFAQFKGVLIPGRNDRLFGKDINEFTIEKIKKYFDYYNVKWVVAWSDDSKEMFNGYHPYIKKMKEVRNAAIYKVDRKGDYFLKGSGALTADYNRIEVRNAKGPVIIMKYHWLETLKTEPELKIEEYKFLDDPVGFIKVHNGGVEDFTVYNAY